MAASVFCRNVMAMHVVRQCCSNRSKVLRFALRTCSESSETILKSTEEVENYEYTRPANEYRYFYPEFLPDPDISRRHPIREKLERIDMMRRRKTLDIPEFYVGTIMAVTASDPYAPGRKNRFVGICISRSGYGLRANFILRNVIDSHGVEIMYEMYNPSIQTIEVLKLEKRLDEELFYLRDAPPEYNTFPFDMPAELHPEGTPVPINQIKVKLKPRPWHERWERKELRGVQDLNLPERFYKRAAEVAKPYEKYDLMKQYRKLIPEEEQLGIMEEVEEHHKEVSKIKAITKRKTIQQRFKPK